MFLGDQLLSVINHHREAKSNKELLLFWNFGLLVSVNKVDLLSRLSLTGMAVSLWDAVCDDNVVKECWMEWSLPAAIGLLIHSYLEYLSASLTFGETNIQTYCMYLSSPLVGSMSMYSILCLWETLQPNLESVSPIAAHIVRIEKPLVVLQPRNHKLWSWAPWCDVVWDVRYECYYNYSCALNSLLLCLQLVFWSKPEPVLSGRVKAKITFNIDWNLELLWQKRVSKI